MINTRIESDLLRQYAATPIHRSLGLTLSHSDSGAVVIKYDGGASARNKHGNVSGGALAAMIDSAVVQAVRQRLGSKSVLSTIELKVNYLRGTAGAGELTTVGQVEHLGRTTAVGIGRTEDSAGQTVAIGIVTVSVRGAESPDDAAGSVSEAIAVGPVSSTNGEGG